MTRVQARQTHTPSPMPPPQKKEYLACAPPEKKPVTRAEAAWQFRNDAASLRTDPEDFDTAVPDKDIGL